MLLWLRAGSASLNVISSLLSFSDLGRKYKKHYFGSDLCMEAHSAYMGVGEHAKNNKNLIFINLICAPDPLNGINDDSKLRL